MVYIAIYVILAIILFFFYRKRANFTVHPMMRFCRSSSMYPVDRALALTEGNYPPNHNYAFFTWDPTTFKPTIHYSKKFVDLSITNTGGWVFTKSPFLTIGAGSFGRFKKTEYLFPVYPKKSWIDSKIQSKLTMGEKITYHKGKVYKLIPDPDGDNHVAFTIVRYDGTTKNVLGMGGIPTFTLEINYGMIHKLPKCDLI